MKKIIYILIMLLSFTKLSNAEFIDYDIAKVKCLYGNQIPIRATSFSEINGYHMLYIGEVIIGSFDLKKIKKANDGSLDDFKKVNENINRAIKWEKECIQLRKNIKQGLTQQYDSKSNSLVEDSSRMEFVSEENGNKCYIRFKSSGDYVDISMEEILTLQSIINNIGFYIEKAIKEEKRKVEAENSNKLKY
jgi:hypothetical protein